MNLTETGRSFSPPPMYRHLLRVLLAVTLGPLVNTLPARAAALQTGLHYYAVIDVSRNEVVQRGKAGDTGIAFDQLILGSRRPYRILILQAATFRVAEQSLVTPDSGRTFQLGTFALFPSRAGDTDRDGLPDDGELIMGTDPRNPDSDSDGVSDGAEVREGGDPLSGIAARTGIIASVRTPGPALDVCVVNNVALVAMGTQGVGAYNVFAGLDPVSIAQIDTPGDARRVACSTTLLAVADGAAGLAVIDLTDPPAARILHQVDLGGVVTSVAIAGNLAIVGDENGDLAVVDMVTGSVLSRQKLNAAVVDLAFGGEALYALTRTDLFGYRFEGVDLVGLGSVTSPSRGSATNRRLFVGGGYAYATYQDGFNTFSVADAGRPTLLKAWSGLTSGWLQFVLNGSGEGIAAVGPNFTPGTSTDVSIYDATDPIDTDRLLTTFPTPGIAYSVAVYDGLVYCADGPEGLQVINFLPPDTAGVAPTLRLVTNFAENRAEEGKLFVLSAEVTDDVQVRNVEFHIDGQRVATDGGYPFEYRFIAPTRSEGRQFFTIQAVATDTGGNRTVTAVSSIELVADATPPSIVRFAPISGSFIRNASAVGVYFSEALDPATLTPVTLILRGAGPDGVFGNADDLSFATASVTFQEAAAFVEPTIPLAPGRYRLELTGAPTDLAGNPIRAGGSAEFQVFDLANDSDGDCVPDSLELALGLDPGRSDSDGDGIPDGDEDFDNDRLVNCAEVILFGSDPGRADSDGDGIPDGDEDSDGDFITDGEEVLAGADRFVTNPLVADTDGDGIDDGAEIGLGLNPTNPQDAGGTVVIDGRTVTLTGRIRVGTLVLTNNAVLAHPAFQGGPTFGLFLQATNLWIDATSRIDVSALGYAGGLSRYNAGNSQGRTLGNAPGSVRRSGGSHGGRGATGNVEQVVNEPYGDPAGPDALGAGGGSDSGQGGAGGGRVRIEATRLVLDGRILANGGNGSRYAGGGAGGSIWITAQTIEGAGAIEALGGSAFTESSGGGGGRIAIFADSAPPGFLSQVSALGGSGIRNGGPGTIYARIGNQPSQLVIRGSGAETPLPDGNPGGRIVLDAARISAANLVADQLWLTNGAVLTHDPSTAQAEFGLLLNVRDLVIESGSAIDVSGRGYAGGLTLDGDSRGRTLNNAAGSFRRTGGSHGGLGASGNTGEPANPVYGDYRQPSLLGSGGGSDSGAGGRGGGRVRILADTVTLRGPILANGFDGSRYAGGGSGGSIWVECRVVAGDGELRANGGRAGVESGGGGGGRIAVYHVQSTGSALGSALALPGVGATTGGPGTLFFARQGANPLLIVRGAGIETPLPAIGTGADVILDASTLSGTTFDCLSLSLINGAVLTHPPGLPTTEPGLDLTVNRLSIDGTSRIDLTGRGYPGGLSRGNGLIPGITFGNREGSGRRAGGSHGGLGGTGNAEGINNPIYGSYTAPVTLGAGGGSDSGAGGAGGGRLRLQAQQLQLAGAIIVNGAVGSRYAGGGAGGSLWISAATIEGDGLIFANGGRAGVEAGTGGGGRVAVHYGTSSGFVLDTVECLSPTGSHSQGASGTIYLRRGAEPGLLIVRGAGRETPAVEATGTDNLLVDGATLSARRLTYVTLDLVRGAILTHPGASLTNTHSLTIESTRVSIDGASRIDASGRGYLGGLSTASMGQRGRTLGNVEGGVRRVGGSYGGWGAFGNQEQVANDPYGAWNDPSQHGSGGGSDSQPGGPGGGLIHLTAGELHLNGLIASHGGDGSRYAGGGSGGGIRLVVGTIRGDGSLRANGGGAGIEAGSGGGGRIALSFTNASAFNLTRLESRGGLNGLRQGTPGTIHIKGPGHVQGDLIVSAADVNTPSRATTLWMTAGGRVTTIAADRLTDTSANFIPGSLVGLELNPDTTQARTFTIVENDSTSIRIDPVDGPLTAVAAPGDTYAASLVVDRFTARDVAQVEFVDANRARSDRMGRVRVGNFDLIDNAVLTHPGAGTNDVYGLDLVVLETMSIDTTSRVDVSDRGHLGGLRGENAGQQQGRTANNSPGSTRRVGGSYGGLGALGNAIGSSNDVYGDHRDPRLPGSGGGSDSQPAGNGGGYFRVAAGTLNLNGQILAQGGTGSRYAGGGSGGGINIEVGSLGGGGRIAADGGDTGIESGGGGGGRIAVRYATATGLVLDNLSAQGGNGVAHGAPGTLYTRQGTLRPRLTFRGAGRETPLPLETSDMIILLDQDAVLSAQNVTASELILRNGAVLTHPAATLSTEPGLTLTLSNLVVGQRSRLDVTARGYLGGLSGENTAQPGRTLGNASGSTRRYGGSHGGLGGAGNVAGSANPTYGDAGAPSSLGSGGGSDSGPAGSGGGRIAITTRRAEVQGEILANGGSGPRYGGGGSGGSIHLIASEVTGSGTVRANGGASGVESGGGGGGRIALRYGTSTLPSANLEAMGGVGATTGSPGTVSATPSP